MKVGSIYFHISKKSRLVRAALFLILFDQERLLGFTNHFSNNDTEKLTTAPKAAKTTVLITSDEPMFTATVKAVPETVPNMVPLCVLLLIT
jgi:hypothetical protein